MRIVAHPQAGAPWEGMVVEEICRQLDQRGVSYDAFHYRAGGGAEVDLVLEGAFGLVLSNEEQPRLIDDGVVGLPVAPRSHPHQNTK